MALGEPRCPACGHGPGQPLPSSGDPFGTFLKTVRELRETPAEPRPLIRTPDGVPPGWYILIGDDGVPELGRAKPGAAQSAALPEDLSRGAPDGAMGPS